MATLLRGHALVLPDRLMNQRPVAGMVFGRGTGCKWVLSRASPRDATGSTGGHIILHYEHRYSLLRGPRSAVLWRYMMRRSLVLIIALAITGTTGCAAVTRRTYVEIPDDLLADKIQGGLLGQILGNLNGLPHELKYNDAPGNVESYFPALPEGAHTDDDTDIEWIYVIEMQKSGSLFVPYPRIAELWSRHVNTHIWCANEYARLLMSLGIEPPLTGRIALNPWSSFNISGQFVCEAFGLIAPCMPQAASRLGLHYTHVSIDGEPAQATQLFDTMIATAFIEADADRIVAAGQTALDRKSVLSAVVSDVRQWYADNPADWRKTWHAIHRRYARHGGMRDFNGSELNTAAIVGSLLYGQGDFVETVRLAFNFGWDADCNAATAGTIVGVMKGRKWMEAQGWTIRDTYRNLTRPGLPEDETITSYGRRLVDVAHKVILAHGGEKKVLEGRTIWRIATEKPANVEPLPQPTDQLEELRNKLLPHIHRDLTRTAQERARAAYLAVALGEAEILARDRPSDWQQAVAALKTNPKLPRALFRAPASAVTGLQDRARGAGLEPAPSTQPDGNE